MVSFKRAERTQVKFKGALTGCSGSGKSYSSLLLASGLSPNMKIAAADTENGSLSLYSDLVPFDVINIEPPYTIPKFIDAIKSAQAAGYEVLLLDSISHAWAGEGGLLAKKSAMDERGGNSYTNWNKPTREQEEFMAAIQMADIHLIVTMRSKQEYVLELNDKGKQAPRKIGMAPIQRDGTEYLFTTVFDMAMDHNATTTKDRTGLFDGQIFKINADAGRKILGWLQSGKPAEVKPTVTAPAVEQPAQTAASKPSPFVQPEPTDVLCSMCQTPTVLHTSGAGYRCPKKKTKDDGHLQFAVGRLAEFRARATGVNENNSANADAAL